MVPTRRVPLVLEDQPHGAEWVAPVFKESDGWRFEMVFTEQAGKVVVQELHITPESKKILPPGGLTKRRLEALRWNPLRREAIEAALRLSKNWEDIAATAGALVYGSDVARPGRRGHPDSFYADLAIRYEKLLTANVSSPVKVLAHQLGVSRQRAADLIFKTRRKGFLTPARRGRAEGRATQKAHDAIAAEKRRMRRPLRARRRLPA